jgi:DNA polymerase elongation subunit (family B)
MSFTEKLPSFQHLRSGWQARAKNDQPLLLQGLDWYARDAEVQKRNTDKMSYRERQTHYEQDCTPNRQYVIDVVGVGPNGETTVLHITEFKPYFFIQLPPVNITNGRVQALIDYFQNNEMCLPRGMKNELLVSECRVEHYYKFHGYQWETKTPFLRLVFHSNRACKKLARQIEKGCILPKRLFSDLPSATSNYHYFPLFESNTEATIRFLHDRNLNPSGWIRVNALEYQLYKDSGKESNAFVEAECLASCVHRDTNESIGKLMIASFDIEADSSHGDFPMAIKDYTKPANEIILLYLKLLNDKTRVSTIQVENWLKHMFGVSTKKLDEKTVDALSLVYPIDTDKNAMAHVLFHKMAAEIVSLVNVAISPCVYEGDVVNVHTPGKKSTEKDNIVSIKPIPDSITAGKYGNLYLLKKKQKWVKLMDADGIGDKTDLRFERENGFRHYYDMTSMEWKRRKTNLHRKINQLMQDNLPPLAGDKVIQIGTVFWRYGDTEPCLRHLIALNTCDDIEGVCVESYRTEREVLLRWSEVMRELAPNIVTGYNIFGFDYKFMWERADALGVAGQFGFLSTMKEYITTTPHRKHNASVGRNIMPGRNTGDAMQCTCHNDGMHSKLLEKELVSAGLGENRMYYMDVPGMVQIDMMKDVMKDHNLSSYRLDDVASTFIHGRVLSFEHVCIYGEGEQPYTKIISDNSYGIRDGDFLHLYKVSVIGEEPVDNNKKFRIRAVEQVDTDDGEQHILHLDDYVNLLDVNTKYQWGLGKDDVGPQDIFRMQKEGSAERAIVGKYCVQDCQLVLNLMMKLQTVSNNMGMSRVCCVPFQYIFTRGQGIKTFSLVNRECNSRDYRIPYRRADGLDVTQMSPRDQDIIYEKGFSSIEETEDGEKETYQGAFVLEPKPGVYLEDAVAVLDYSSLYPSSIISHNLCASTIVLEPEYQGDAGGKKLIAMGLEYQDVTYDNYKYIRVGQSFEKRINTSKPTVTCRFIQPKKQTNDTVNDSDRGITPQTLRILLSQRKATRNRIKTEKDPFVCAVLDGLQLAYKVTANSVYGSLGATTSPICFKQIAASTTATGRNLLLFAKKFVEDNFDGAEIVYGDTDSIFINFHPKDEDGNKLVGQQALEKSIELGIQAGNMANEHLLHPHDLEYEKTFYPFVLLSKKRYVGMKYETDPNKCKLSFMGIVLKRRDNAQIVKVVYADVINTLMEGKTINESIRRLRANIKKLIDGEFPLEYLILSKSLKSHYDNPEQMVHKVLADRMAERDPGNKPQANDRIPYAYIDVGAKKVSLQGERVEHPDFIRKHNLPLDAGFYISNQISKPVSQIYALVLEQLPGYKYRNDPHYFTNLRRKYKADGRSEVKIAKKIEETRMAMASDILFGQYLRTEKNKREGSRTITEFFTRK